MEDRPLVSVIVPVYNVERYVEECIESIRGQSLRDIEILILDDGSTDGSAAICQRLAAQDGRIQLFHHENIGQGATRNRGIRLAAGRYLAFVDSDDWIEQDHLRDLYQKAVETGADIVQGEAIEFWDGGERPERLERSFAGGPDLALSGANIRQFFRDYYFGSVYKHFPWGKLYERSFVDRWGIEFGDNRTIAAEDTWFHLQALVRYPHITFTSGGRYRYRQRAGSIMHSPRRDLVARQGRLVAEYDRLIHTVPDFPIGGDVCAMVAVEALTMPALDRTHFDGDRRAFLRDVSGVRDDPLLVSRIAELADPKVRALEPKRGRRAFLGVIGTLYRIGAVDLANEIVWQVYRIKERRWKGLDA